MDVSSISPTLLIASLIVASTPIMLAAIGELVVERAGVLNLGVEGMMITGAICGFIVAYETGSPIYGVIASILGGAALSLIFAILTQFFLANQVASGLALTLFGLGFSALIGKGYTGITPPDMSSPNLGFLTEIPFLGKMLFEHDYLVYLAFSIILLVSIFLRYTRQGLILRAVGEDHSSAHALGYKVIRVRVLAILFGGGCAGLGGAYISLIRVPQWAEGMTHGAGWIALAIVVFASWKPMRILFGAWLFGGLTVLQLNLQAAGVSEINLILFKIPLQVQYLTMAPYLITILVLVLMSARALSNAPGSLGKSFHVSD
jgi:ABC-type uncharacterized transport system permease subunit|tara:strand:- start:3056 stop:4009 length:954 start_codon:yes stop_codon:yes gene_type:complete